jgi:predicted transcriptional regulator
MKHLKSFNEKYEFEDFTHNDMEMVKELYEEGMMSAHELSREMDLSVDTIEQILWTLRKRGDIE